MTQHIFFPVKQLWSRYMIRRRLMDVRRWAPPSQRHGPERSLTLPILFFVIFSLSLSLFSIYSLFLILSLHFCLFSSVHSISFYFFYFSCSLSFLSLILFLSSSLTRFLPLAHICFLFLFFFLWLTLLFFLSLSSFCRYRCLLIG